MRFCRPLQPRTNEVGPPTLLTNQENGKTRIMIVSMCACLLRLITVLSMIAVSATGVAAPGSPISAAPSTYDQVTTETAGHAESVEVIYDPSKITYGQLLRIFFSVAHDPTQLNRQGPDVGTSYRSALFYTTEEQKRI